MNSPPDHERLIIFLNPLGPPTTMSNPDLPPEIFDHIVDFLQGSEHALRACCLVSKSWIPRTRRHLFADLVFQTERHVRLWKRRFPDPSTSPAYYVKALSTNFYPMDVSAAGWARTFSRVVRLGISNPRSSTDSGSPFTPPHDLSYAPFHGFSPVLRSLRLVHALLLAPNTFSLVLSFPLLEDLAVLTYGLRQGYEGGFDERSTVVQPSNSPVFTGSLEFSRGGMSYFARELLSLPGGIHFRRLDLTWSTEDEIPLIMGLVEECYRTLESIKLRTPHSAHIRAYFYTSALIPFVISGTEVGSDQPLESDESQIPGFSSWQPERRMGQHGAPNYHTQTSRSSANLDLRALQIHQCRCQR